MNYKPCIDEYRENLIKRHGQKFLDDLDEIFKGKTKLNQIAKEHGLSKMRITQIFQRVYGKRLKDVKAVGYVEDSSGFIFDYGNTKETKFLVSIPEWLYNKLKKKSEFTGYTMKQIVRDALDKSFIKKTEEDKYDIYT